MSPTGPGSVPRPAGTRPLALSALADLVGDPVQGDPATPVRGVTLASPEVRPGDLYAALPGTRTHGARFAADAAGRGAVAVLTDPAGREQAAATGLPVCVVDDPRGLLGAVAARVYGEPARRLPVVGITGTNGKTTTSYLVEAGLTAAGRATGLIGTVQSRTRGRDGREVAIPSVRTTPEAPVLHALLAGMAESGVDTVVMEVSSHALVQGRVGGVPFAAAGFTNLSQDHLDFHRDLEDYFRAKALLFDGRAATEVVVVDDEHGRRLAGMLGERAVTVSAEGADAHWTATAIGTAPDGGSAFTLTGPGGTWPASVRLPGRFNVTNAVLAVALLDAVGVPVEAALEGVAGTVVPGRMEPVDAGQPFTAAVDYAHTPDAVATAAEHGDQPPPVHPTQRGEGGGDGLGGVCVVDDGGERLAGVVPGRMEPVDAGQPFTAVVDYAHTPEAVATALAALRGAARGRLITVLGCGGDRDPGKRPAMGAAAATGSDLLVVTDDNPRSEDPAAIRAGMLAGVPADRRGAVLEIGDRRAAIARAVELARPGDTVLVAGKGHETGQEAAGTVTPFDDRAVLREVLTGPAVGAASR